MKVKLLLRLINNELTNNLVQNLSFMYEKKSLKGNSIIIDYNVLKKEFDLQQEILTINTGKVMQIIKWLESEDRNRVELDSIEYCIDNRFKDKKLHNILKCFALGYIIRKKRQYKQYNI